jgi:hypothetical protein
LSGSKKVYVVTEGEYSDFRNVAVFDDEALATRYVDTYPWRRYDHPGIEEHVLNERADDLRAGLWWHMVWMNLNGDRARVTVMDPGPGDDEPYLNDERIRFFVKARNEEHAIKIANERRGVWLSRQAAAPPPPPPPDPGPS